jgi:ribosome-associated protein
MAKKIIKKSPAKKVAKKSSAKLATKKANAKKSSAKKNTVKKVTAKKATVKKTAKQATIMPQNPLLASIIDGLEEKKAKNITILDLTKITNRAFDYFVIADAESTTHVDSIADSVEEVVRKQMGEKPHHTEGWENAEWILLDYVNIIVHVFQQQIRSFYRLEDLWADAEIIRIN